MVVLGIRTTGQCYLRVGRTGGQVWGF